MAWVNKDQDSNARRTFMLDHVQDLMMFLEKTLN